MPFFRGSSVATLADDLIAFCSRTFPLLAVLAACSSAGPGLRAGAAGGSEAGCRVG